VDYSREDLEKQKLNPYPMHLGSAEIKPVDLSIFNNRAANIVKDAFNKEKKELEELILKFNHKYINTMQIYDAEYSFEPVVGNTYYLYERENGTKFLSMIKPKEWGENKNLTFLGAFELQSDYSWKEIGNENN
jgi:hypothetical protein